MFELDLSNPKHMMDVRISLPIPNTEMYEKYCDLKTKKKLTMYLANLIVRGELGLLTPNATDGDHSNPLSYPRPEQVALDKISSLERTFDETVTSLSSYKNEVRTLQNRVDSLTDTFRQMITENNALLLEQLLAKMANSPALSAPTQPMNGLLTPTEIPTQQSVPSPIETPAPPKNAPVVSTNAKKFLANFDL